MAEETTTTARGSKRPRRSNERKSRNKRERTMKGADETRAAKSAARSSMRFKKVYKRRAEEYNSDDDDAAAGVERDDESDAGEEVREGEEIGGSDVDDDGEVEVQQGITKFADGCKAFRVAFSKIMKKSVSDGLLGPVLSAHKKLVIEKLAEEEEENESTGRNRKEKIKAREKGHVKPLNFLDAKEKFLISVATKGVVKLFNAVNKAQAAQKGLNPSHSKDAKVLGKRRKEAFYSELRKKSDQPADNLSTNPTKRTDEPGWAPLRESYMFVDSKMKNWDKLADPTGTVTAGTLPLETSSDDE
ncbi:hypothetical protein QJS04_geneDACA010328 [Acorus gramineus]|uniref:RRP15-like protein n=1 Tax=Acorus gramineus TaxID=55184 RepID=A0AAV9A4P5_ACOGR|nr:hypothetical protein QJS04_geneDACA010328 [Acorus gramineus]